MIQKKLPFAFFTAATIFLCGQANAQLFINSATFFIQPGATVTVQGNVTSNTDIQGTGLVLLNGTANQTVDMGGSAIPKLQINNAANATLLSNVTISDSLILTTGKISLGTNNLTIASTAGTTAGGATSFIETNGTGQVIKDLAANVTSYQLPVGLGTSYRPATITTVGTYSGTANVGVRVATAGDPNKPPMISDYLLAYWPITQTGITGTLTVGGQYINGTDVSGTPANLKGYFFNGTDWSSNGGSSVTASNTVSAPVTAASGDVYGMDGFVVLKAKAFLQGAAYNTTTGLMSDALRAANLVPLSDPYRAAPYSPTFTHVANTVTETTTSGVLASQANTDNNIVDWVFLELRNTTVSPGNTVLQTRSALLEKNGTIVDVDGVSPVTFNNVPAGSYTIAVRHRNHLGISANPATNLKSLTEQKSVATALDFTTATPSQIYNGTAASAPFDVATDGKILLWAGNANFNTAVKYSGPGNDPAYILGTVLATNVNGSFAGYSAGDVNMNGSVKYSGPGNDAAYILSTVLTANVNGSKTQALPN
jgi:hypothetical protein